MAQMYSSGERMTRGDVSRLGGGSGYQKGAGGYRYVPDRYRYPAGKRGGYGQTSYSSGTRPVGGGLNFGASFAAFAALATLNPADTRHAARTLDAYLTQFLPDGYFDPWAVLSSWFQWGAPTPPLVPGTYKFGAQWTTICTAPIHPEFTPISGVGFNPYTGHVPANIGACGTSIVGAQNAPYGTAVPPEATQVQECVSNNPFPSTDGFPFAVHQRSTAGSPTGVTFYPAHAKAQSMPLAQPLDETHDLAVSYGQPSTGRRGTLRPYQIPVREIEFRHGKPPRSGPGVHDVLPPSPREKEDKGQFPGRSIAEAYGKWTEVGDALDCLEKNIKYPKSPRYGASRQPRGSKRVQDRIAWVLDQTSRGHLDVPGFMACFVQNQATDALVGIPAGAAARQLNRNPYNPRRQSGLGFMSGGFSTRMR